jgi:GPH family glycoside/pentoside/hexuronide:cation symporter
LMTFVTLTSFYVYGSRFELNWLLAGLSLSLSYVVIGLTHWLTGYYSDRIETRWGRRRPFVVVGTPALVVSGFLLFVPNWFLDMTSPTGEMLIFIYYLTTLCSFKFSYAFLMTAYQAWLPEVTDEEERPLVSSMQNTFNWLADASGAVLAVMSSFLFSSAPPHNLTSNGLMILLAFCGITLLSELPSMFSIREKSDISIPRRNLRDETGIVLHNRTFVGWIMAVGFLSFTFSAFTSQLVGFLEQVLTLTTVESLLPAALAMLGSVFLFLYLWITAIRRIGKRKSLIVGLVFLAALLPLTPLLRDIGGVIGYSVVALMFFVPFGAGMAIYYLMSYIVPADIAQVDEIVTGESRSGMYTGFLGVPLNMFQAASALVLGWLMNFSETVTGSELWGLMWWGPVFAPTLLIAALVLHYIDIDPDFESLRSRASAAT